MAFFAPLATPMNKVSETVFKQAIKHLDIMVYLVWVNIYVFGCRAGLKPMRLHWAPRFWDPAPWCLGRLFIFARYTLRLRNQ